MVELVGLVNIVFDIKKLLSYICVDIESVVVNMVGVDVIEFCGYCVGFSGVSLGWEIILWWGFF